jgi:Cu/Ag efflux protein CusF
MRVFWVPLTAALALASCGRAAETPAREYELKGQILAVRPERNEVVIKHEDITGFMPGMTMPFKVKEAALLQGKQPGDLVTATLVVAEVDAHLRTLEKTGHAPLETPTPIARHPSAGRHDLGCEVCRSKWRTGFARLVSRPSRGDDVHLYTLPAAGVLSVDGSAFRRRAEDDREHAGPL